MNDAFLLEQHSAGHNYSKVPEFWTPGRDRQSQDWVLLHLLPPTARASLVTSLGLCCSCKTWLSERLMVTGGRG